MTPSRHGESTARMTDLDLEAMLARSAEEGAWRPLAMSGLAWRYLGDATRLM